MYLAMKISPSISLKPISIPWLVVYTATAHVSMVAVNKVTTVDLAKVY
jgi:hypothetical protein